MALLSLNQSGHGDCPGSLTAHRALSWSQPLGAYLQAAVDCLYGPQAWTHSLKVP